MKKTEPTFKIRPFRKEDAPSLARYADDRSLWDNVRDFFPHPYSEKDAQDFIALTLAKPRTEDFAIEIGGEVVGGIGFVPGKDVERAGAEIGYWLGKPFRGDGIMFRVVQQMAAHIFSTTGIVRLFAPVFGFNAASARTLEKAGFSRVGILHCAAVKNGRIIDMHLYELVKPGVKDGDPAAPEL